MRIVLGLVLIGLLVAAQVAQVEAACTTYILPDGSIMTVCCNPNGTMCQFM
jgi:hypothetical protein